MTPHTRLASALITSALALSAFAYGAHGATQGAAGATSTGTINLSLTVASTPIVRISDLHDMAFNPADANAAISSAQNICIYSSTATKGYTITATGDGGTSHQQFSFSPSTNGTVNYTVSFSDVAGGTGTAQLTTGQAKHGNHSTATAPDCGGGDTASLSVGVSTADLNNAAPGTNYTGVLTLSVGPE